jgi:hypothetical protein
MWYATDELAASVSGGDTLPLRFLRYWAASWQDPLRMAAIATLRRVHKRLKPVAGTLLCRVHLTRFEEDHCLAGEGYRERLDFKQRMVPLFCCRHCGKPDHMMIGVREVVCVVDTRRSEEVPVRLPEGAAPENGVLRAFWVRTEPLFDFDVVEIVHTDDFEVERFCIQVGNDTDPFRAGRCRTTRCRVAAGCELSENTRRILKATFGKVEFDDGEA